MILLPPRRLKVQTRPVSRTGRGKADLHSSWTCQPRMAGTRKAALQRRWTRRVGWTLASRTWWWRNSLKMWRSKPRREQWISRRTAKEDRPQTTFLLHSGSYFFRTMVMDNRISSNTWLRASDKVVEGQNLIRKVEGLIKYRDRSKSQMFSKKKLCLTFLARSSKVLDLFRMQVRIFCNPSYNLRNVKIKGKVKNKE